MLKREDPIFPFRPSKKANSCVNSGCPFNRRTLSTPQSRASQLPCSYPFLLALAGCRIFRHPDGKTLSSRTTVCFTPPGKRMGFPFRCWLQILQMIADLVYLINIFEGDFQIGGLFVYLYVNDLLLPE
mgnify:CR=1 FL=1|jgi:hypothetical protein